MAGLLGLTPPNHSIFSLNEIRHLTQGPNIQIYLLPLDLAGLTHALEVSSLDG